MGLHRILVIDESAAIRETVAIILGSRYEVSSTTFADLLSAIPEGSLDLIIAGAGRRSGEAIELFPRGVPVLCLAAGEGPAAPVQCEAEAMASRQRLTDAGLERHFLLYCETDRRGE